MEMLRTIFTGSSTVLSLASLLLAAIAYQTSRRTYLASRRRDLAHLRIEVQDSMKNIQSTWHGTTDANIERHMEKLFEVLANANTIAALAESSLWDSLLKSFRAQVAGRSNPRANDA